MPQETLSVALVHEVFHDADGAERLTLRLHEARRAGADLAVLPELPLHPWLPATRVARDEDAEAPYGPRHERLAAASRAAGIGLVGGVILRDRSSARRSNCALVFDATGRLVAAHDKARSAPLERGRVSCRGPLPKAPRPGLPRAPPLVYPPGSRGVPQLVEA